MASLFRKIGNLISGGGKKEPPSAIPSSKDEDSPIRKMHKRMKENYGLPSGIDESAFSDEMSEEEKSGIMKKLFPFGSQPFKEVKEETPATVEQPQPAPFVGVPTMDAASGGTPSAASQPKGTALPGAVGKGMKPVQLSAKYPSGNGKNSAVESGGMAMMQDPLLRFPINPRVLKHFQSRIWITYNGCALISTHEFVNRACAIPAEDAIAHGYKVICSSHSHEHNDKHDANEARFLFDVKVEADKMGMNEVCVKLNFNKKVFGVAVAVPLVEFLEDAKSPTDSNKPYSYADPYDPTKIKPGSYRGFSVVDPIWTTYEFDDESANDPISPNFYVPTWIHTRTRKIHRSWTIRVLNSSVPDILKPQYYFGGLSLTQMIYERVWCADKLANEAPLLAMTKRLLIADGNLEQLISDPRHTNIFFKAINYFRDNFSIFVKKPSSNVTQLDTSLADLAPLMMSQYQLMAAIAQIPITKLLKNVPSGLQATGEYEWDDYAQSLIGIQQKDYTPLLRMHYELYVHSNYPKRTDIDLDIEWNPIDVPKESEVTQMSSQTSQFIATLLGNGVVTVGEARSMLRRSNLPTFQAIAPEVPEILKKLEDAKDPEKQAQMGGFGGMGGGMPPGMGGEQPNGQEGGGGEQPQPDPVVVRNEQVLVGAMNRVLKARGENPVEGQGDTNGGEQPQQPKEGEEANGGTTEPSNQETSAETAPAFGTSTPKKEPSPTENRNPEEDASTEDKTQQ